MTDGLIVHYRLTCGASEVDQIAKDIAYEQTVEVPEQLVPEHLREQVVGQIRSIKPNQSSNDLFEAVIEYPIDHTGYQWPQFLNLIYGNISLKKNIFISDIKFPQSFLDKLKGPNHGIDGIRKRLGVYGRPLLSTALKPYGSSHETFADMTRNFALGGGDLIKDDHNLHESSFDDFKRRVSMCHQAALDAEKQTGRPTLYCPNVMAPVEDLDKLMTFISQQGIFSILICPFTIGLDTFRYIVETYPLCYLAHPSFTGAHFFDSRHGISHGVFLGTLFRLLGADVSIFPNYGGRFSFTQDDCHDICDRLRQPMAHIKSAFPSPAGGMKFDNIPTMGHEYGEDTLFLIGGALISHSDDLAMSTKAFMDEVRKNFDERLEEPDAGLASACELPTVEKGDVQTLLKFAEGFKWQGRQPEAYKDSAAELPFKNVSRCELIGKSGEQTAYDLRYFEIGPNGLSSLEKHNHTHTVICVRGSGVLKLTDKEVPLAYMDIAYVEPMQVHQLCNNSDQPFGFFCIVDHDRDRPVKP